METLILMVLVQAVAKLELLTSCNHNTNKEELPQHD